MRFNTIAAAATVAGSASAVSICDKYTTALLTNNTAANQYALVTLLVKTAAVGNFTGPGTANPTLPGSMVTVPGILAPGMYNGEAVNLLPYFDGTFLSTNQGGSSGVSVNWLDGGNSTDPFSMGAMGSNQFMLISHLTQYFGVLLGCSLYGTSSSFPKYGGDNSQYNVHKFMDLSEAEHSYFIEQVGLSAASFGASTADINAAATALNSTFGYRCAPPAVVAPGTPAMAQAICQGADCPLSPNATCSGLAADGTFTPSAPASTMLVPYPTGTASTIMPTGTGVSSSMPAGYTGAAAPRQTAAAGLLAAFGVAAALL